MLHPWKMLGVFSWVIMSMFFFCAEVLHLILNESLGGKRSATMTLWNVVSRHKIQINEVLCLIYIFSGFKANTWSIEGNRSIKQLT